jgi:hypothetical protein
MRVLSLLVLVGCGAKQPVVMWANAGKGITERIELASSGDGNYTSTIDGVPHKEQRVILTKEQIEELAELLRSKRACELAHDPAYTPAPDEGQTTLELAFPDLRCKIVLWNIEWQQGRAKDIAETMQSMRPLRPKRDERKR